MKGYVLGALTTFLFFDNTSQACHPGLLSTVPSSRCEGRLTVCERSATQKCINLPKSFYPLAPGPRQGGSSRDKSSTPPEVFASPQQYTVTLPHGDFLGTVSHTISHSSSLSK